MNFLLQRYDGAGFFVGEGLLVNELTPAPVILVFNVHFSIISLLKKG